MEYMIDNILYHISIRQITNHPRKKLGLSCASLSLFNHKECTFYSDRKTIQAQNLDIVINIS